MSTSKIPSGVIPAVKLKCAEVVAAFPAITHVYGYAASPSDHVNKRCIDFMVPNRAAGDAVAAYIKADAARLGVNGQIWWAHVMGFPHATNPPYRGPSGTWRAYSGTSNMHYDHVHVEFDASDYEAPAGAVTPPPLGTVWIDLLVPGVTDSDSWRLVQQGLGVPQTGTPDAATIAAAKAYQASLGDDVDGWLGQLQVTRLFADKGMSVTVRLDPSGEAPTPTPPVVVPPVKPTPPVDPKPVPAVHSLTFVFNNPLWNNDTDRKSWSKRKAPLVKEILSLSPDVFAVCEIDPAQADDIYDELPAGWGYWRINGNGRYGPLGIFWKQSVMERQADALEHEYSDNDSRYLLSLPLVHKESGEMLWFDCTHLENDGDTSTNGGNRRKIQATELAARTKTGKRIGGGDLNTTTAASSSDTTKPRVIMRKAGLTMLTQQSASKVANRAYASHHSSLTARPKGAWIDEIWWRGVTFNKGGLKLTSNSDHHIVWADFTI